ncbi:MAG: class II SORL domain-containing protein [Candidatus Bathyarchaeota archaeon]|jgi:superoxide reductase|nr:class II SORL domain-containing protein [Candidatus Bathyarchaeota archaeon]
MKIDDLVRTANWKIEKHVPVIDCMEAVAADEVFEVKVAIGKEVAHPNTTEHHINWISLYFQPEGDKFPYQVGHYEFTAHGASVQGPNTGAVYAHHAMSTWIKINKPGTLFAISICNIHGLWQSSKEIKLK